MAEQVGNFSVPKTQPIEPEGFKQNPDDEMATDPAAESALQRKNRVLAYWDQVREAQAENRHEMAIDEDFKDGDQWTAEDKHELETVRGQPALTFNLIGPTCRWLSGTEKRSRVDFSIIARKEGGLESAEEKTMLLKYVSDVNKTPFHFSQAFEDSSCVGLGWIEEGIRTNPEEEALFVRYESWRNMWYDHLSIAHDLTDARFCFRKKWIDLDIAQVYFPDDKAKLMNSALSVNALQHTDDNEFYNKSLYSPITGYRTLAGGGQESWSLGGKRQRVPVVECWYRDPVAQAKVIKGEGGFNGAVYNEQDEFLKWLVENERVSLFDAVKMQMRVMIFCEKDVLVDAVSPYWHNRFPFTPIWGYRRKRDNAPYGMIRNLRDPQEDLNKRRSKALFILSTKQVIYDKGAVDDVSVLEEELARPDGMIEKNPGKSIEIKSDNNLAKEHLELMEHNRRYIGFVSGIEDDNLGRKTNAVSGRAIEARQDKGSLSTFDLYNNMRFAHQVSGEKQLALTEQFYKDEKEIRILGPRNKVNFQKINQQGGTNIVTSMQAEFKVDEQSYQDSIRRAMFETMLVLVEKLPPEIGIKLLDLVIEQSDVPGREEMVARIREINGQSDPDDRDNPEKQAAEQAQKQQEREIQMRQIMADLELLEAKAKAAKNKGDKVEMEAITEKLEAMTLALEIAGTLNMAPELASTADIVMTDGARGLPDKEPVGPVPGGNGGRQ